MGIPYYVASLLRKHKHIERDVPRDVDVLAIDFNCFIHHYLQADNPIGTIVVALNTLMTEIVRAKKVYIAFDGLVPYAKILQQRYRRMRKQDATPFDKHQISPGTPFMKELAYSLRFMYPEIVVSDTLEPGEGEHKVFQWLRTLPEEERKSICIYGLDADLVLIAMAQSHLGDIQILRESEQGYSAISISALKNVLPMNVDEFVHMSILCFGNDFMPTLAAFSLREDGYGRALFYKNPLNAHKDELKILCKRAKDHDRRIVAPDGHALETRFACQLMDGVVDWEPVTHAFWKTYMWTYHYFTTSEVLDWSWHYPYAEAPLLETLVDFEIPSEFTWEHPTPNYTIEDQLQFILPTTSLATTGISPKHPDELYDEATETRHPWMKRYAWECDPYISLPWGELTSVTEVPPHQFGIPH